MQLIAVECCHDADIAHNDILDVNVIFGSEPEPVNNKDRKDDVMYDTDVFLFGKVSFKALLFTSI